MKKLIKISALALVTLIVLSPAAFSASQSTSPITISAEVPAALGMTVSMHENSSTGPVTLVMDFGTLDDATGTLRSSTSGSTGTGDVVVLISGISSGLPYTISETSGTPLTSGTDTVPAGACVVTPAYADADNGGAPLVGVLGTPGSWVGTRILYTSDAIGSIRTIQAHFAVVDTGTPGATENVPLNQPAGTYTGTVTFTVSA